MLPPPFSPWVLLGLVAVLAMSCLMFWAHVRRWTQNRHWIALRDWAADHGFRLYRAKDASVPVPLAALTLPPPNALIALGGRRTAILQLDTPAIATAGQVVAEGRRWNALVREIDADWAPTALRPATHEHSLVDLFGLQSFPALLSSERYTIHGQESAAARAVVSSMLMALLPKDLALILHGRRLVIDFSTRPFDGIELSRLVALADQLATHLPAPPKATP
jgi:hypothetical protein